MKHFLLLVLVCALGYFLAPQVLGIKPSASKDIINQGEYLEEDRKLYRTAMGKMNSPYASTSITFMLVLDELESVQNEEKLVTIEGNDRELGFLLTGKGIEPNWAGKVWDKSEPIPYARLLNNENVVTVDGQDCLALTMLVTGTMYEAVEKYPGITLVDASENILYQNGLLNTLKNSHYKSIRLNEKYVTHVSINSKYCSIPVAAKRAARLEKKALQRPGNKMVAFGGGGLVVLVLSAIWSHVCPVRRKKSGSSAIKRQGLTTH